MRERKRRQPHYSRAAGAFLTAWVLLVTPAAIAAQKRGSFTQQVEARVFVLVNEFRREHDLKPLERESRLGATASYFAGYMARTGTLDHHADGNTPAERVKMRGYPYCVVAENIAYEYSSRGYTADRLARNLVEGWRDSPTHRANMLDPQVTETGIGIARNHDGEYFAAQLFARPSARTGAKRGRCR